MYVRISRPGPGVRDWGVWLAGVGEEKDVRLTGDDPAVAVPLRGQQHVPRHRLVEKVPGKVLHLQKD